MKSELQQGVHSSTGPLLLGPRENISHKKKYERYKKSQIILPQNTVFSKVPFLLLEGTLSSGAEARKPA